MGITSIILSSNGRMLPNPENATVFVKVHGDASRSCVSSHLEHKRRHLWSLAFKSSKLTLYASFSCPSRFRCGKRQLLLVTALATCQTLLLQFVVMITHLYAMDSQTKAQELASKILAASSPPTISAACEAIEAFLHKQTVDQSRFFFSVAFPVLICKIFGFEDSSSTQNPRSSSCSTGWMHQVHASNDSELAGTVFRLLSPSGILLSSITSVDRHSLVKYVFPVERLPQWARYMLQSEKGCRVLADLCPLFKGRMREEGSVKAGSCFQLQLNVFEYYIFWFAYYPVCRGSSENSDAVVVARKSTRKSRLENWTSSFTVLAGATRVPGQKSACSLYIRLLHAYLHAFVPNFGCNSHHQPYRSSLLHYSSGYDGSFHEQTEFFVYTLTHFWLVDNDFSPLPVNVCRAFGVSLPLRVALGDTPPTPGLGEAVGLFVKYLNSGLNTLLNVSEPADYTVGSPWRVSGYVELVKPMGSLTHISTGDSGASWNSLIQRPLYRYILRTFLFCPMGTSIKNVSQVFSLWIGYMEPWKIGAEDFLWLDTLIDQISPSKRNIKAQAPVEKNVKDNSESACGYTSAWESYVLSNYLFYTSLVMHFLGFAHKFLHIDPEAIIQMVLKMLNVLTSSVELIELMKKVDAVFHSKPSSFSSSRLACLHKFVPSIRDQLQDWEDGLCETDADGSFLPENWNQDLRLFSEGADGGPQLLQLLIMRAESEIQSISSNNLAANLMTIDSLKSQMSLLFGGSVGKTRSLTFEEKQHESKRDELFKPRMVGNQKQGDVNFKGDWMKRPISNGEVAWLARMLVRLSDWLNETLGLNQGQSNLTSPSWIYLDVSNHDTGKVAGPREAIKMVLCSLRSWLLLLVVAVLRMMKEHGFRVNLRGLASKKFVTILVLCTTAMLMGKALGIR